MKKFIFIIILLVGAHYAYAQTISDYLITNDIGSYKAITKGGPRNIAASAEHFGLDHNDAAYGILYSNDEAKIWIDVQVTQHAGADSDKWLLHELDAGFRTSSGIPNASYKPRTVEGQMILEFGSGGKTYRWISANKVVNIKYLDLQMQKPEPLDVVKAYLAKYPSSLSATTVQDLGSAASKTTWIKDEMERRLWLCDKWVAQIQPADPKLSEKLKTIVDSMNVFLDYREKYYGVAGADEKSILAGYRTQNNVAGIQTKLAEYKTWWAAHKGDAISIQ